MTPGFGSWQMQKKIQREVGAKVTISKCYRAKKIIEGDVKEQYRRLWDYAETIRVTNPGSCIKLETELWPVEGNEGIQSLPKEIAVFSSMYVRFSTQKQAYFAV